MHQIFNLNYILSILIALSVHEFAHAYTAYILGDKTSKERITLNPLAHLDFVGTIMLLLLGFGWAKPVSINSNNFKNPIRDTIFVSLSGPISNFIIAFISFVLISYNQQFIGLNIFLSALLYINLGLGIFNLIPIFPLDGSYILLIFAKSPFYKYIKKFINNGYIILIFLIGIEYVFKIPLLSKFIYFCIENIISLFNMLI